MDPLVNGAQMPCIPLHPLLDLDPPVNQAQMPCIPLHPLLDIVQGIYIEGRWTPSQSSTDALHTGTPTARFSTMHIYRRQMDPLVN